MLYDLIYNFLLKSIDFNLNYHWNEISVKQIILPEYVEIKIPKSYFC